MTECNFDPRITIESLEKARDLLMKDEPIGKKKFFYNNDETLNNAIEQFGLSVEYVRSNPINNDKKRISELETFIESHGLEVPQVDWVTEVTNIEKGIKGG